ncbi:5-oxoprolinase subunit C family protein [Hymenobacter latericus]|uniref:5-oxoprolinase subunit C family protein n=1 Tax=Hymenobacter sp. YIM 151858-1 TaxID=2987688 RepID=UPI002225FDAF|nr:biotin-dependent carboxyltransferase family protein [Hymenobacter sp. YIM 151858-1]UYZ59691.1 biotin-dependent carboxyltransferase family protein [Hymenobacter sp. YIM 151858-1]
MSFSIISPGLLTTVQDLGRVGYQKQGIIVSGAMDATALRLANLLVGNPENTAGLELTLLGPKIRFEADHLLALTGADLSPAIDGEPVRMWRPMLVRTGAVLSFGAPRAGSRAYLAVAGGLTLPSVLGSLSTYLRAGLGGLQGRALRKGDVVPCAEPTPNTAALMQTLASSAEALGRRWAEASWAPDATLLPRYESSIEVRVTTGPEYHLFSAESQENLWAEEYSLSTESDRMGYRLLGPGLALEQAQELLSSAVTFATVQVPAGGLPIVLMADHQTAGGYPRIVQVITADFSRLAQLPLGGKIRFREVTLAEAQQLYLQHERQLRALREGIQLKLQHT